MTDFRALEELWVFRDGEHVAYLRRLAKGCEFHYTDAFLSSGRSPIALHLPKEGITVEGVANLPTYFAGLLPEGIMLMAARNLIGAASDDLFAVLAATGADAIGDIDVRIPGEQERRPTLGIEEAAELIGALLHRRGQISPHHLAAIPGVQPKLSLGQLVRASRKAAYIAKFDSPDFPGLLENEFAFMRLARRCRLHVAETRLESNVLVVTRFDRVLSEGGKYLEKVHVEDMLQTMDRYPHSKYSLEYRELLEAMRRLGVSKATLLDALRLYVFSYIIGNGDLHAKNVSLVRGREDDQWRLSPAYDLLSTLPYAETLTGADRMALALMDEAHGRFAVDDFIRLGREFGLPARAVEGMIDRTAYLILKNLFQIVPESILSGVRQTIVGRAESLAIAGQR